jgi:hypothetical protein
LHWSKLDLAEDILRSIPSSLDQDASILRLKDLLTALRYAERGRAIFPLSVPASQWWSPIPHTNLPLEADGLRLTKWYPARVQRVEDEGNIVVLLANRPEGSQAEPCFEEMQLSRDHFQTATNQFDSTRLHAGSYIEIGHYGDWESLRIGIHAEVSLNDPDLLPLVPPPNRWYDRAVAESWQQVVGDQ